MLDHSGTGEGEQGGLNLENKAIQGVRTQTLEAHRFELTVERLNEASMSTDELGIGGWIRLHVGAGRSHQADAGVRQNTLVERPRDIAFVSGHAPRWARP